MRNNKKTGTKPMRKSFFSLCNWCILIIAVLVIILFLTGCSFRKTEYTAPKKYYSEILMTTHSDSEKQNVKYNMKILCNDEEYKIIINHGNVNFFIQLTDGKCTLINDKFTDNQILGSLTVFENLYSEIDLDKFTGLKSKASNTVEAYEGLYKYVLEYNKNNFSPQKLYIYKDDFIIKTFEYNNVELYKQ